MERSLDGLIRHLLVQIALCGEHGASSADFIGYVKNYYGVSVDTTPSTIKNHETSDHTEPDPCIDRHFLEQVWKWIAKNSEIRVGKHTGHQHLTLSQVEQRNTATGRNQGNDDITQARSSDPAGLAFQVPPEPGGETLGQAAAVPEVALSDDGEAVEQTGYAAVEASDIVKYNVYAQGPDSSTPSSQNKRVVQTGQTNETHVASETSSLILTKSNAQHEIRLYTSEKRMWHALTGHGPDIVKVKPLDFNCLSIIARFGSQGILQHHLTRLSGQDKRSLPARTDRLHEGGYIIKEQLAVREGNAGLLHTSRCILKRFAEFDSDQTLRPYPTQVDPLSAKKRRRRPLAKGRKDQVVVSEPRPVPQWTADRSVSNQIFDLVDKAGAQGMSMSDIRDHLFGTNIKKVAEDYVSRLVENWQTSQPLHLRHLSIVRDTVLKGKSQIYVYYTFANFQKLVDQGKGFWEAVTTVSDDVREGNNVVAALNAQPDVDEYGFPNLDANQFQGRFNDATLADIASALDEGPLPIGHKDPILKQTADGNYGTILVLGFATRTDDDIDLKYRKPERRSIAPGNGRHDKDATFSASHSIISKPQAQNRLKQKEILPGRPVPGDYPAPAGPKRPLSTPKELVVEGSPLYQTPTPKRKYVRKNDKPRGRPRKYPKTGVPENVESMSAREVKKMRDSQEMAEKYEKFQMETEILRRIEEGEDPIMVTGQVLAAADDLRKREGEDHIPEATRSRILYDFAGGPEPDSAMTVGKDWISKLPPAYQPKNRMGRRLKERPYLPSMAAHSYPTHIPRKRPAVALEPALEKCVDEVEMLDNRTRRKRTPVGDLGTLLSKGVNPEKQPVLAPLPALIAAMGHVKQYLPSVAAHSWPMLVSSAITPQNKAPRKRGRPRKGSEIVKTPSQGSSSLTASLASSSAPFTLLTTVSNQKRKQGTYQKAVKLVSTGVDEGCYPGWVHFMSEYYEPQLRSIPRPHDGIFLGETMPRRKRPGEPDYLRPKETKLVIFRSARLKTFDWLVAEAKPLQSTAKRSRSDTLATPNTESSVLQDAPSATAETSTPSQSIPPISTPESLVAVRPSDPSSSAENKGTKRKRGNNQQPTSDRSAISGSGHSPPRMGSSTTKGKPRTLLVSQNVSKAALSPPTLSGYYPQLTAVSAASGQTETALDMTKSPQNTLQPDSISGNTLPGAKSPTQVEKRSADLSSGIVAPAFDGADSDATSEDEEVRRTPETPKESNAHVNEPIIANFVGHTSGKANPSLQILKPLVTECVATLDEPSDTSLGPPRTPQPLSTASHDSAPPTKKTLVPTKKAFGHMSRQGGSSAILRKNIIMDLVERCGGVFPNHRELSKPFAVEWHRKGQEGYPEPRTLQNAVTALCSENKIRRITFTAQTTQGLVVTKDIIVLASVENSDPKVKELQDRMVAAHPRLYLPIAVMPLNDPHSIYGQGPRLRNGEIEDVSGSEAGTPSKPVATPRRRRRRNNQGGLVDLPPGLETFGPKSTRNTPIVSSKLPFKRTANECGSMRGVQRLASLQDTSNESITRPEIPSTVANGLTWLSSEYAFSELNLEDGRPTILRPAIAGDTRRLYDRYATVMNSTQAKRPKDPREQAKTRMRGIAQKAAQIERRQAEVKATRPSLLYSDFGSNANPRSKIDKLQSSFRSRSTSLDIVQAGDAVSEGFGSSPTTTTVARRSSGNGQIMPSLSDQDPIADWQTSALEVTRETQRYRRSYLVGFMDPLHVFYKQNGTFSVTFSGIQPPRKIIAHRGTCVYPYIAELKSVHPFRRRKGNARLEAAGRHEYVQPLQQRFLEEVDNLLEWELSTLEVQGAVFKNWPIINHDFPHRHTTIDTVAADHKATRGQSVDSETDGTITITGHRNHKKRARKVSFEATDAPNVETPLKRRRLLSVAKQKAERVLTGPVGRPTKYRRVRGPRGAKYIGENGEQRLFTAVMVIRTLTGGIDKQIDWVLVAKVFEPDFDQILVHSRWSYVLTKYKFMVGKWESDFQDLFAQAYEEGTVPVMDFDNLKEYDWKWLVEWVMAKIDTAFQSQPELPAERDQFLDLYTIKATSEVDITDFYELGRTCNVKKRTDAISRNAYVIPLEKADQSRPSEEAEQLSTAKSWVRANIITPQETYNSAAARAKLSIFPEIVIEDALKQLLLDKTLMQQNKGRLVPGRNYDVSGYYLDRFRKRLLSAHFQRAIDFKRQLDHDFVDHGYHSYSYTADDGDVLAVFNLMANKRIKAMPINVPLYEWGLTDGYESRLMDKKRLKFDIELRPLPEYIVGNPLEPYIPPPSQHLQESNAKIPTWYDIHGSLVPVMWEMCLAAVLCVLAMRPGAGSSEIEKAMRPAMEDWEVQNILQWLVSIKAAKTEGIGYSAAEWWWLGLGGMENLLGTPVQIDAWDKGKDRATSARSAGVVMELDGK